MRDAELRIIMTIYKCMILIILSMMVSCLESCKIPIVVDENKENIQEATEQDLLDLSNAELMAVLKDNAPELSAEANSLAKVSILIKRITNSIVSPHKKYTSPEIDLHIVPADEPIATSYYPNILLLSTSVINPTSPCGAEDEAALIGVLAHEIAHLWFGHTKQKWINRAYANSYQRHVIGYTAHNFLTRFVPIWPRLMIPEEYTYDVEFDEWYFESVADLFAINMISAFGRNPDSYVKYVEKVYENAVKGYCAYAESPTAIDNRLGRLTAYMSGAAFKEKNSNVIYIFYDEGEYPRVYQFNTNITFNRETGNRILYWQYAALHNKQWCAVFWCSKIDVTKWDKQNIDRVKAIMGENFEEIIGGFFNKIALPLRINGYDSLIFGAQPELTEHLEKTGEVR